MLSNMIEELISRYNADLVSLGKKSLETRINYYEIESHKLYLCSNSHRKYFN